MITQMETKKDSAGNVIVEQKYNHLAAAEMTAEDNYNKIDGIIDTKPSFEERIKEAKSKANAHNSRKSERHKEQRHGKKADRHKKDRHDNDK